MFSQQPKLPIYSRVLKCVLHVSNSIFSYLRFHGISVDLAHVLAGITALNTRDVQLPCVVTIVGDRESGIVRHHVVVNAKDGLCVSFDPRHLQHKTSKKI